MGSPKQPKNLLFAIQTPPAMVIGIRPEAVTAIRVGTLDEVIGRFNPGDKPGKTPSLTRTQKSDPVEYVGSP